ncbi:MAG: guanylate kinase [Lachnospiraceae bacterium]|nr:guanylate kinase [Lachnospiraceae bacterium]
MDRKGILIVVSGYSGVGKGTLMKKLIARYEDQYALSVSVTTRKPREGEVEGRDYFFKTWEEFEGLIARDELIEHAVFCDNYYGTPRKYVEEQLLKGRDVILEIEQKGARLIKEKVPDAVLVFVMPPDAATLEKRLRGRGTEPEEVIRQRLLKAVDESKYVENYEYMIVNDDIDRAVEELHQLVESQHKELDRNLAFAREVQADLRKLVACAYPDGEKKGE